MGVYTQVLSEFEKLDKTEYQKRTLLKGFFAAGLPVI
jgi:hypothetical protein